MQHAMQPPMHIPCSMLQQAAALHAMQQYAVARRNASMCVCQVWRLCRTGSIEHHADLFGLVSAVQYGPFVYSYGSAVQCGAVGI